MKKEKIERGILGVVEKVAKKEIKDGLIGWPPICNGFVHQPRRPKVNRDMTEEE